MTSRPCLGRCRGSSRSAGLEQRKAVNRPPVVLCAPDSATIDYCVQNQSLDILSQGIAHSFIGLASITPAANMGMNQVLERPVKGGIDRIGRRWKQRHASADKQHLSASTAKVNCGPPFLPTGGLRGQQRAASPVLESGESSIEES